MKNLVKMEKAAILLILFSSLLLASSNISVKAQGKRVFYGIAHYEWRAPPLGHFNYFVGGSIWPVLHFVFEPLAHYLVDNDTFIPWLAERWNYDLAAGKLTIYLHKNVKWQDGEPFTSEDVLAFRYLNYPFPRYVKSVSAPDKYTVVYNLDVNYVDPMTLISLLAHYVHPAHVYKDFYERIKAEALAPEPNMTRIQAIQQELQAFRPEWPIGTGPWKLKDITDEGVLLEKWNGWWRGADTIPWDELHLYRGGPERREMLQVKFLAGEIYHIWTTDDFTPEFYTLVKEHPEKYTLVFRPSGHMGLYINCKWYPFSMKEVRQALYYAFDEKTFGAVSIYAQSVGLPLPSQLKGWSFIPETIVKYYGLEDFMKKLNKYEYNPSKAEEILRGLGFTKGSDGIWVTPNGTKLDFDYPYFSALPLEDLDFVVTEWFGSIGIKLTPVPYSYMDFFYLLNRDDGYPLYHCFWTYYGHHLWQLLQVEFGPGYAWGYFGGFRPGTNYPQIVEVPEWVEPGLGTVNMTTVALEYFREAYMKGDFAAQKKWLKVIAWYANEYVPFIPMCINLRPLVFNNDCVDLLAPGEPNRDPIWLSMPIGDCFFFALPLHLGLIRPKAAPVTPPIYTYVTAYAKVSIPAFTGVDGKAYGPYKEGDAMLIPKEDAEKLVAEGKATYSPPVPAEIPKIAEAVSDLLGRVSKLETSTSAIRTDLDTLSRKMDELSSSVNSLSGQIANITTTVIGVGVVVIILAIIGIVVSLRKK